ncbi:MAG: zinc-ribbon domain-containing protein [Cellulosilyticaceae bacterium]
MKEKYMCPECGQQEVEKVNACGSSTYFCNNCKKLISKSRIEENDKMKKEEK